MHASSHFYYSRFLEFFQWRPALFHGLSLLYAYILPSEREARALEPGSTEPCNAKPPSSSLILPHCLLLCLRLRHLLCNLRLSLTPIPILRLLLLCTLAAPYSTPFLSTFLFSVTVPDPPLYTFRSLCLVLPPSYPTVQLTHTVYPVPCNPCHGCGCSGDAAVLRDRAVAITMMTTVANTEREGEREGGAMTRNATTEHEHEHDDEVVDELAEDDDGCARVPASPWRANGSL